MKKLPPFLDVSDLQARKRRVKKVCGCAKFIKSNLTIQLKVYPGGNCYEVDLERCNNSKEFSDWVLHIGGKEWGKNAIFDFIECFDNAVYTCTHKSPEHFFQKNISINWKKKAEA